MAMRLPTAAWFAFGCGLAGIVVMLGAAGHRGLSAVRSDAWLEEAGLSTLQVATPAPDDRTSTVVAPDTTGWESVPVQRPRQLDRPGDAPPPMPLVTPHPDWKPSDARLPNPEATALWDPDDPRMPDGDASVVAVRADWSPNSATLPRPRTRLVVPWNPNDARLPSS